MAIVHANGVLSISVMVIYHCSYHSANHCRRYHKAMANAFCILSICVMVFVRSIANYNTLTQVVFQTVCKKSINQVLCIRYCL